MALPTSDLQFTISVKKAATEELKKRVKAIGNEVSELGNLRTREYASFAFRKRTAAQALGKIRKKVDGALKEVEGATQLAVQEVLEKIKIEAQQITPVDTGALHDSAFVAVETANKYIHGKVGYNITSGPVPSGVTTGVNYAVFVHETPMHHNNGQWKFFQAAVESNQMQIKGMLVDSIKKGVSERKIDAASIGEG